MFSTYERKNIYKSADENTLKAIFDYSEGYKRFLDNGKTERETVEYTVEMLKKRAIRNINSATKSIRTTNFISITAVKRCSS